MYYVHYHKDTGQISAWGTGQSDESHFADHLVAEMEHPSFLVDPKIHKIDLEYLCVIEKTPPEKVPARAEIDHAIADELSATDCFMVPDRPLPEGERDAWSTYRQTLRDLSKLADVPAMVKAWPVRPDGVDFIPHLRARVPAFVDGQQ